MRVRTTFTARRHLRTIVMTDLMSAYRNDANARRPTPPDICNRGTVAPAGAATLGTPIVAGWSGSTVQEIVT
jgi:hypothetical protein